MQDGQAVGKPFLLLGESKEEGGVTLAKTAFTHPLAGGMLSMSDLLLDVTVG